MRSCSASPHPSPPRSSGDGARPSSSIETPNEMAFASMGAHGVGDQQPSLRRRRRLVNAAQSHVDCIEQSVIANPFQNAILVSGKLDNAA